MKPDAAIGDRHQSTRFKLPTDATEYLFDHFGDIGAAEPFLPDANHRWSLCAAHRQQPMKVGVKCYDDLALVACKFNDLKIGRKTASDIGNVARVDASLTEMGHGTSRQSLVQQESDQATSNK